MKTVWYVSLAFSALAFVLVFVEKELKMRTEVDTEFGLEDRKKTKQDETALPVTDDAKVMGYDE